MAKQNLSQFWNLVGSVRARRLESKWRSGQEITPSVVYEETMYAALTAVGAFHAKARTSRMLTNELQDKLVDIRRQVLDGLDNLENGRVERRG